MYIFYIAQQDSSQFIIWGCIGFVLAVTISVLTAAFACSIKKHSVSKRKLMYSRDVNQLENGNKIKKTKKMSEATDSAVCYNQSEDLELEELSQPKDNKVGHLFFLELICTELEFVNC